MNILLINHYAGSIYHGMEYRPYYLAREWVKSGHTVTIVAASFSHLRQKNVVCRQPLEEIIDGIRYLWLPTPEYHGNTKRRFWNMLYFIYQLYRHGHLLTANKPDVVIASSTYPLDAYPARRIAKATEAQFVFELHDLWPLSPMELGRMSRYHPFIWLMQRAEDDWCKHADRVISILPKAESYLRTRGLAPGKFFCVPNGIAVERDYVAKQLPDVHQNLLVKLRRQDREIISYTGAHGVANALDVLLQAAARLKRERISFVLVGQGQEKEHLQQYARRQHLEHVHFLPPLSKTQMPTFLMQIDLLYIGLQRQNLFQYGVSPNKLMDYMLAAKPIIHAIDAGNDFVAEARCGISVPAEDGAAVAQAIRQLVRLSLQERKKMGNNGRRYVLENHDYRILAQNFLRYLQI